MNTISGQNSNTSKKLPSVNGVIDWDKVAQNYFDYILSPYASEMVEGYKHAASRNLLLNYIHSFHKDDMNDVNVLDMGCGPGNLIPYIGGRLKKLVGIDRSITSLQMANEKAVQHAVEFEGIHEDILELKCQRKFDFIISSNSILPESRHKVIDIFSKLASLLADDGKLLAILPSFDTTLYLKELREKNFECMDQEVLMNVSELAYADDGKHMQCYHTIDSIYRETELAGLCLKQEPQKVYYPWNLCRDYGYGYYPHADEEIWDWFIVAQKRHNNSL